MREVAGIARVPPGATARPRLLALLDHGGSLTVLRGAGGLGKTTLLAQWVAGLPAGPTPVWLTLDPTIATRAGFWVRVLGALHRAGLVDDAGLYRESAAVADDGERAAAAIGRTLAGTDVVLVLDDFGGAEGFWDEICLDLVGLLADGALARCVVAGSVRTRLEDAAVNAAVSAVLIGPEALRFTPQETAALAAAATAGSDDPVTPVSLPPRFLGVAALAPYLDESLAAVLAPGADGAALLAGLVRDGHGHWSALSPGRAVVRLSETVRAAAAGRLATRQPQLVPQALALIARWLATERADPAGAVEYALRAGDLDLADRAMMWAYPLARDDHAHLAELLEALPGAGFVERPLLALTYALYLNAHPARQGRAAEYFVAAAEAARRRTPRASAADRVVLHGLQTAAYRLVGRRRRMIESARWTLRSLPVVRSEPVDPAHGQALAVAVGQAATSLLTAGDLGSAAAAFDDLAGFAAEQGWGHFGNLAASGTALVAVLEGRLAAAREALALVRPEAWPEPWHRGYPGALRTFAQAWVHLDDGDPEAALTELALLEPDEPTLEHWDVLGAARALARAMLGQAASAGLELAQLRRRRETGATLPGALARLSVIEALLQLAAGRAGEPVESASSGASRSALQAVSAAARGEPHRALALLARAEAAARTPVQETFAVLAGAILARRGRPELSLPDKARRLAAVLGGHGLRWPLVVLPDADRAAVLAALTEAGDIAARDLLAAAFDAVPAVVTEDLWRGGHVPVLTRRERAVLLALADTGQRSEIARRLFVSVNTVKAQLRGVYRKLGVASRDQALARAINLGLLSGPAPQERRGPGAAAG